MHFLFSSDMKSSQDLCDLPERLCDGLDNPREGLLGGRASVPGSCFSSKEVGEPGSLERLLLAEGLRFDGLLGYTGGGLGGQVVSSSALFQAAGLRGAWGVIISPNARLHWPPHPEWTHSLLWAAPQFEDFFAISIVG